MQVDMRERERERERERDLNIIKQTTPLVGRQAGVIFSLLNLIAAV
jgi:hypothetical protein